MKKKIRRFLWVVVGVFPLCAMAAQPDRIQRPVDDRARTAMRGNVRPLEAAIDMGGVEASVPLPRMTLHFNRTPAQEIELQNLLREQQDPASPNYHRWLTPEQFADRFGVSENDMAKVADWLQEHGFKVLERPLGRGYIAFSGTVGQVEAAFRTQIRRYNVNGEAHFTNASDPSLPTAIAEIVVGVRGLEDFRPKARGFRRVDPRFTSSISGNHFLTPDDFAIIYHLKPLYDQGVDGTGQWVAVMGQTGIVLSDIATFRSLSGLAANVPFVQPIPASDNPKISTNDIGEADLDIEWAGAVARNATVIYVNAGTAVSMSAFDALSYTVNNPISPNGQPAQLVPVISISYGDCEAHWQQTLAQFTSLQNDLSKAAGQGQTVVGPSGDAGASDCESSSSTQSTTGFAVDFPASSPFVTGVGGTMFNDTANPSQFWASANNSLNGSALMYIPEMVWNETAANGGVIAAGGGGVSTVFTKPAYQTALTPADGQRDVPDISLAAGFVHDGYLICASQQSPLDCTNGFRKSDTTLDAIGGTSAGAPTFAGMVTLLNHALVKLNPAAKPVGPMNPLLYQLAATSPDAFHDITTGAGDNKVPCTQGSKDCPPAPGPFTLGFAAGPGYDLATGLGSVDAYNLITELSTNSNGPTPAPPDFTMSATTATSISVSRGSSGSVTVQFGPTNGFNGNVTVTCVVAAGVTGVSCPQLPMAVAVPPGTPLVVTIAVSANAASASLSKPGARDRQIYLAFSGGGITLAGVVFLAGDGRRKRIPGRTAFLLGMLPVLLLLAGCGGGGSVAPPPPPPPAPFATTMAIQAARNADIHVVSVTLNVN